MCKNLDHIVFDPSPELKQKIEKASNKIGDETIVFINSKYFEVIKEFELEDDQINRCIMVSMIIAKVNIMLTLAAPADDETKQDLMYSAYTHAKMILEDIFEAEKSKTSQP